MGKFTFLGNIEIGAVEKLYRQYLDNPESIDESWQHFFRGFEFARTNLQPGTGITGNAYSNNLDKEFKVINYINTVRRRGHLFTKTNPVRTRRKYTPSLDIENSGLSQSDLETEFQAGKELGIGPAKLKDIVAFLHETYCQSVGAEYMFIRHPEKLDWLVKKMEGSKNKTEFPVETKKKIFSLLVKAAGFESFIHKKFVGQKRFSLEGTETMVPALHFLIEKGSELGVEEFVIGMAHRGRLNVLGNILNKPYEDIFREFVAEGYDDSISLGDVKYHLGYCSEVKTQSGKQISLKMAPNPSHLEAVSPVIQGISRARIDHTYKTDFTKLIPILIHGDAAIAGQGVVYEVVQMSELSGYRTGGTIHIVINNQVGFTTNYLDARSSTYSTDIGKVIKAPIFHVNGDDVEALVHTVFLAIEYRQRFFTDVFIDILSYRKHGHNEGDEPRYSQPTLYKAIANHPNPRDIYARQLVSEGIFTEEEAKKQENDFDIFLEEKLEISKKSGKVHIQQFLRNDWQDFKHTVTSEFGKHYPGEVNKELLKFIGGKICYLPPDENFIKKTVKLVEERKKMLDNNMVDWALGELLAYGTLLYEGHPVRISGQDSVRGTFAHRHAAHVIEDTDKTFTPLKYISKNQAPFNIYNSPLNEYGVLGFEYGYALATPKGLTVWEAQFGDFHNVAQVIVDQYISSAEEKWGLMNGLVLYLPHGFEGQGPEHSSARIERFLSLAAKNNMQIVNPTIPSNIYHLLRQSIHRNFRIPLVIFTPKSLLRHPKCSSTLDDLVNGHFEEVIDDQNVDVNEVRRLVFCSGKIYYELLERKEEYNARDVALIRIEQLHPFPAEKIEGIIKKYKHAILTLWVQEEPINMGAWRHVREEFKNIEILPVSRQASGSPATGLSRLHALSQEEIIGKVFRKCVCELNNKYCGLQCPDGSLRQSILEEYRYFDEKVGSKKI
ncbi:MAG: 2-oxoglutarate dehydrogenase E1 component [Bacteroidales bacterium]|nr:2-oxoglutarate dehydrogenase E1 component [Bacteroidales bacterium]